jgi:ribose transport system permease protein
VSVDEQQSTTRSASTTDAPGPRRHLPAASFRKVGALYVWALIIVVFSIWQPHTFPTIETARGVLNDYAVTGLVALGLVVPLAAGVFDLSIGYTVGLSGVVTAYLLSKGMNTTEAALLAVVCSIIVGTVNAFVVVVLRVDSFIGTLGTGAIISAITLGVSNNRVLTDGLAGRYARYLANGSWDHLTVPVLYLAVLAVALGVFLEQTAFGRRIYATGFDTEAARLSGVSVRRARAFALIISSTLAGFAGLVVTARLGAASPTVGPDYLLPAFAAAFLGATQFRPGRFNPWGTVVAVLMIGTGQAGILLAGAPAWASSVFQGVVLILAVSLTGFERRMLTTVVRGVRAWRHPNSVAAPVLPPSKT